MSSTTHAIGSNVSFLPGPKSKAKITGTVKDIVTTGKATFLLVGCTDGRDRKIRPGAATAA
jgi:hypothetical protein